MAFHQTNPGLPASADRVVMEVVVLYLLQQAEQNHIADKLISIYNKLYARSSLPLKTYRDFSNIRAPFTRYSEKIFIS